MQNINLAKEAIVNQNEFYKEPLNICKFLCKTNYINKNISDEINSWEEPITQNQPLVLAKNMCGKILTAKNYVKKIIYDYLTDNKQFSEVYKPHLKRHFVNYLLQKKVAIINEKTYDRYEFIASDTELLSYIFCVYEKLGNKAPNKAVITYNFPKKTVAYYAIATHSAQLLNEPITFPETKILLSVQSILDYKRILADPFTSPYVSLNAFEKETVLYCQHLVPDCELTEVFLNGLHAVHFKTL